MKILNDHKNDLENWHKEMYNGGEKVALAWLEKLAGLSPLENLLEVCWLK